MTPLGIIIISICVLVGLIIGYVISKRYPNLFSRDKKIQAVINNPQLLVEKLTSSRGKIYDMGKELDIKVGKDKETGQDIVVVEEKEVKRAKEIQKQITKKTEKKELKTKKKRRKKGVRKK